VSYSAKMPINMYEIEKWEKWEIWGDAVGEVDYEESWRIIFSGFYEWKNINQKIKIEFKFVKFRNRTFFLTF
jgi:hypothetical protein